MALTLTAAVIFALGAIVAVILSHTARRWRFGTEQLRAKLDAARRPIATNTYGPSELIGLPEPVQRYFRAALRGGQQLVAAVNMEHRGTFNPSETGEHWKPFVSTQRVVTQRPGFDWDARIAMIPGVTVRVHDAYVAGEGLLRATLFGLVPLAEIRNTPMIAQGELMRFVAEAAWYPTALLPSQGVQWKAVNDRSAMATLRDADIEVTLLFRFNEHDLIDSVHADARAATVGKSIVMMPWECRMSNYQTHNGMIVPLTGEVAWVRPEGRKAYYRGTVTSLTYEFSPGPKAQFGVQGKQSTGRECR
jgi:hypothetical protein